MSSNRGRRKRKRRAADAELSDETTPERRVWAHGWTWQTLVGAIRAAIPSHLIPDRQSHTALLGLGGICCANTLLRLGLLRSRADGG
jgi:hypothetical protein